MQWDIPQRFLSLTLEYANKSANQNTGVSKLDINDYVKFSISESVSGALTEATIVVSGLTVANMFDVATSTTQWIQNWQQNKLTLRAGYTNNNGVLFRGAVVSAEPNLESATYTLTMKCMDGFDELSEPKSYNFPGTVPVNKIVSDIAADAGLVVMDDTDGSTTLTNFTALQTNYSSAFRSISDATGLEIFINSGRVYIKYPDTKLSKLPILTIDSKDIIGVPQPTQTGVIITIPLNPAFRTGCGVRVNSVKYPQLNSLNFYCATISHQGDTHGRDWYSRLNLVKEGLGYYAKQN